MSIFKVGDKVMVRPEEVDNFVVATASKIRGRVGVVTGLTYPHEQPIVTFPKEGRKKEYMFGRTRDQWLILASEVEQ